jgi:hypothetical protein
MIRPDGWDLEDSKAVTRATCDAALGFLSEVVLHHPSIPEPRFISAITDGSIALQWKHNGASAMVLIDKVATEYYRQLLDKQGGYVVGTVPRAAIIAELASSLI